MRLILLTAVTTLTSLATYVQQQCVPAPSSTKNASGARDPETQQTKKGNNWHFGMKAHIGVDAASGLVHTSVRTPANVSDVTQAHKLLHGQEREMWADAGYQGAGKRVGNDKLRRSIAMRPGKRWALAAGNALHRLMDQRGTLNARIRAKVEHRFRVLKSQFGFVKVRYRGIAKNAAQAATLFMRSNLRMARRRLQA